MTKTGKSTAPRHDRYQRTRGRRALWVVAILAVVVLALLALDARGSTVPAANNAGIAASTLPERPAVGYKAPDFTLPDLQGRQISLHSLLGKPVLLHFWAVDCTTCQGEQPAYLQAIHDLGARAPTILAVDAWGESRDYVAPYVAKFHLPGAILIDPPHSVFDGLYQGQGTPTTVYIDRHGVIRELVIGPETRAQIVANARLIGA